MGEKPLSDTFDAELRQALAAAEEQDRTPNVHVSNNGNTKAPRGVSRRKPKREMQTVLVPDEKYRGLQKIVRDAWDACGALSSVIRETPGIQRLIVSDLEIADEDARTVYGSAAQQKRALINEVVEVLSILPALQRAAAQSPDDENIIDRLETASAACKIVRENMAGVGKRIRGKIQMLIAQIDAGENAHFDLEFQARHILERVMEGYKGRKPFMIRAGAAELRTAILEAPDEGSFIEFVEQRIKGVVDAAIAAHAQKKKTKATAGRGGRRKPHVEPDDVGITAEELADAALDDD